MSIDVKAGFNLLYDSKLVWITAGGSGGRGTAKAQSLFDGWWFEADAGL